MPNYMKFCWIMGFNIYLQGNLFNFISLQILLVILMRSWALKLQTSS